MRHINRTLRLDFDWLFERLHLDPAISMRNVNTKEQIEDLVTQSSFTVSQRNVHATSSHQTNTNNLIVRMSAEFLSLCFLSRTKTILSRLLGRRRRKRNVSWSAQFHLFAPEVYAFSSAFSPFSREQSLRADSHAHAWGTTVSQFSIIL